MSDRAKLHTRTLIAPRSDVNRFSGDWLLACSCGWNPGRYRDKTTAEHAWSAHLYDLTPKRGKT